MGYCARPSFAQNDIIEPGTLGSRPSELSSKPSVLYLRLFEIILLVIALKLIPMHSGCTLQSMAQYSALSAVRVSICGASGEHRDCVLAGINDTTPSSFSVTVNAYYACFL